LATEDIERREVAKMKPGRWMGKMMCKELVLEMIMRIESLSSANQCIELILDCAWRENNERKIRNMLDGDDRLISFTSDLNISWRVAEIRRKEMRRLRRGC
jgi:hypothetical protein